MDNKATFLLEESTLTKEQKDELKETATNAFAEAHHRLPTETELKSFQTEMLSELNQALAIKLERFSKAFDILAELLPTTVSPVEWNEMREEFKKASEKSGPFKERQNYEDYYGLSNATMDAIFNLGVDLLKKEKNNEAVSIFDFLTQMNPDISQYWLGYGLALKKSGNLKNALYCFGITYGLDEEPVVARVESIECYLALGEKEDAKIELDELEKLIKENPELGRECKTFVEEFKAKLKS